MGDTQVTKLDKSNCIIKIKSTQRESSTKQELIDIMTNIFKSAGTGKHFYIRFTTSKVYSEDMTRISGSAVGRIPFEKQKYLTDLGFEAEPYFLRNITDKKMTEMSYKKIML